MIIETLKSIQSLQLTKPPVTYRTCARPAPSAEAQVLFSSALGD